MSDPSANPASADSRSEWQRRPAEPTLRTGTTPLPHAEAPSSRRPGDSPSHEPAAERSPLLVAIIAWLLPGAGYWLIGQRWRAMASGVAILLLFVAGLFIGGIRVVDVPGFAEGGVRQMTRDGRWSLQAAPMATVLEKPWYLGQILAGPVTIAASYGSLEAARREIPKSTAHAETFGTLYVAVAGMLNLLVIIDSTARGAQRRE